MPTFAFFNFLYSFYASMVLAHLYLLHSTPACSTPNPDCGAMAAQHCSLNHLPPAWSPATHFPTSMTQTVWAFLFYFYLSCMLSFVILHSCSHSQMPAEPLACAFTPHVSAHAPSSDLSALDSHPQLSLPRPSTFFLPAHILCGTLSHFPVSRLEKIL